MSVTATPAIINLGQSTKITCFGLTEVTITPVDYVVNVRYDKYKNFIATVRPIENTLFLLNGNTIANENITLNIEVFVGKGPHEEPGPDTAIVCNLTNKRTPYIPPRFPKPSPPFVLPPDYTTTIIPTFTGTISSEYVPEEHKEFSSEVEKALNLLYDYNPITFSPKTPTVYEGDTIEVIINETIPDVVYIWSIYTEQFIQHCKKTVFYGTSLKVTPAKSMLYIVNGVLNHTLIYENVQINIEVIPKPANIVDMDVIPIEYYQLILDRNFRELREKLLQNMPMVQKIMDFYLQISTAYRFEFSNKKGSAYKMKWATIQQYNNSLSTTVLPFYQQWELYRYINMNQQRNGSTVSNMAFLINVANSIVYR